MRPSRPGLALLGALLALLLAGCGDDAKTKNAYVQRVDAAQQVYVNRFEQVRRRLTATSTLAQDRATLTSFGAATGEFVKALRGAAPPKDLAKQHQALVDAVAGYGKQVEAAAAKLAKGTTEQRAQVRTDLSSSISDTQRKIADAIGQINTALRD